MAAILIPITADFMLHASLNHRAPPRKINHHRSVLVCGDVGPTPNAADVEVKALCSFHFFQKSIQFLAKRSEVNLRHNTSMHVGGRHALPSSVWQAGNGHVGIVSC